MLVLMASTAQDDRGTVFAESSLKTEVNNLISLTFKGGSNAR